MEVAFEQVLALCDDILVAGDEGGGDADRVGELQPDALASVEEVEDVLFECAEAAALPVFGAGSVLLGPFGFEREAGANGEGGRGDAEQIVRVMLHKVEHLLLLGLGGQELDLVDHDHDLLAPVADLLQEGAFRFAEGSVGAGDEEDEVAAGHEVFGQLLVLADDRVGARRIDEVDLLEPGHGQAAHGHAAVGAWVRDRVAVSDQDQFAGGGHDAFGQIVAAEQGVDDGAFAGVELSDDDDEEELLQLGEGVADQRQVGVGRIETREGDLQVGEQAAFVL